jgi:hypothetical protein
MPLRGLQEFKSRSISFSRTTGVVPRNIPYPPSAFSGEPEGRSHCVEDRKESMSKLLPGEFVEGAAPRTAYSRIDQRVSAEVGSSSAVESTGSRRPLKYWERA